MSIGRHALGVLVVVFGLASAPRAIAQELNPGAYTVSPVGANFIGTTYQFSTGDVTFDPSLPIQEAHARLNMLALSYGRALDVAGRSGTLLVVVPVVGGKVHGIV